MRNLVALTFVVGIAGCAAGVPPAPAPATATEQRAALIEYMNCLVPHAKHLDDGRSDAKTIAQAMRGACLRELDSVLETTSRGETAYFKQELRARSGSFAEQSALEVVLNIRNANDKQASR